MIKFIKQFLLHPRRTGAIMPSSPDLAEAMLEPVDFAKANHIVELGPGTGAFTNLILSRMKKDSKLTVLELNEEFCKQLSKIKDPRLEIINGDALKLSTYIKSTDYIISGLPLNNFSKEHHKKIVEEVKKVVKRAYVQFHYSKLGEKYLTKEFKKIKTKTVLRNIPPAIVYTCIQ
jgi:phospholipid N-methyltransferase